MRSYCIDEIYPEQINLLDNHLQELKLSSSIEGMFWLPIPHEYLTEEQLSHSTECAPYSLALILEETSLHLELLVRARGKLHCTCVGYASTRLREYMIHYIEELVAFLAINA